VKLACILCAVLLAGCATAPSSQLYVPTEVRQSFDVGEGEFLFVDFSKVWRIYLPTDPKNRFSKAFNDFNTASYDTNFIGLSKDGTLGARSLALDSKLSVEDFVPLLKKATKDDVKRILSEKSLSFLGGPSYVSIVLLDNQ
jgi:hypothetical protein